MTTGGFREGEYVLGIEGLALLRAGADRRYDAVAARVAEIAGIAARLEDEPYAGRRDLPEAGVSEGYGEWAPRYDDPGNDTIALEQPAVWALLDQLRIGGPVLDAACGTGRHAARLEANGHDVIGVDASEPMLERARARLRSVDLRVGELTAMPLADASVAAAVCALALSHLRSLGPAVRELARVLEPGGRLVISNPHPFATAVLGWRAVYEAGGKRTMIPEYPHTHEDYIAAFADAGLVVRRLVEPRVRRSDARGRAKAGHEDAFEAALTGVPAVIVWEVERAA